MIEKDFGPMLNINTIEVTGNRAIFHLQDKGRYVFDLPPDPDRDNHMFRLPVLICAHRAQYDDGMLSLYWYDKQVAEFTLKDIKA